MNTDLRQAARAATAMRNVAGFQSAYAAVWLYLIAQTNAQTGTTNPSQTKIAAAINVCRETVCRATKWLRSNGFIATSERKVRQRDGSVLNGTLTYRIFLTLQSRLAASGLAERYQALLSRGQLRSGLAPLNRAKLRCDMDNATPPRKIDTERSQATAKGLSKEEAATLMLKYPPTRQPEVSLADYQQRLDSRKQLATAVTGPAKPALHRSSQTSLADFYKRRDERKNQ